VPKIRTGAEEALRVARRAGTGRRAPGLGKKDGNATNVSQIIRDSRKH